MASEQTVPANESSTTNSEEAKSTATLSKSQKRRLRKKQAKQGNANTDDNNTQQNSETTKITKIPRGQTQPNQNVNLCTGIGCNKICTTLKCPTCSKKGLPDAYFCSQECFKTNWVIHKLVHTAKPMSSANGAKIPEIFRGFSFTGPLRPTEISARRVVPAHIARPDYADTGIPTSEDAVRRSTKIEVKTPEQIEQMRIVCKLAREVLDIAGRAIKPGVTTDEIDRVVHEACIERECYPSPLNYRGFPKSCCTSVNEIICHGIPDMRKLEDGDICNVDITVYKNGFHGDVNDTFLVGNVDEETKKLVRVTKECLDKAIAMVKPGVFFRDVGAVIQKHANANGLQVVKSYCGHGIGELFHTAPNIPHYARNKAVGVMKAGQTFTIEPMINMGTWRDVLWPDEWTSATKDGKRSAQFEHTMLVTETGVEILT